LSRPTLLARGPAPIDNLAVDSAMIDKRVVDRPDFDGQVVDRERDATGA